MEMGNAKRVRRDFAALERRRFEAIRLLQQGVKQAEVGRRHLVQLLLAGPERLGYETPFWTYPRVADLIEREFGIRFYPGHVWKVLVSLGWSPQRPQV